MTQKELLYAEDIYNHEKLISEVINTTINEITDKNHISLLNDHYEKHESLSKKIIKLLEDEV